MSHFSAKVPKEYQSAFSSHLVRELESPNLIQLDYFASLLREHFDSWISDWVVTKHCAWRVSATSTDCVQFTANEKWRRYGRNERCFWIRNAGDLNGKIKQEIFGSVIIQNKVDTSKSIAEAILCDGYEDFLASLGAFFSIDGHEIIDEEIDSLLAQPWNDLILLKIEFSNSFMEVILRNLCFKSILLRTGFFDVDRSQSTLDVSLKRKPLVSIVESLTKTKVWTTVELRSFELDFANVKNLAIGDVIRFNHSLDEPVLLKLNASTELCVAYLGKCEDKIAIELLKSY